MALCHWLWLTHLLRHWSAHNVCHFVDMQILRLVTNSTNAVQGIERTGDFLISNVFTCFAKDCYHLATVWQAQEPLLLSSLSSSPGNSVTSCARNRHTNRNSHTVRSHHLKRLFLITIVAVILVLSWLILVMLVKSLELKWKRKLKPVLGCSPAPGGISAQAPDYKIEVITKV